jgi:hypothetical protein
MTHTVTVEFQLDDESIDPKSIIWPMLLEGGGIRVLNWRIEPVCETPPMTWRETLTAALLVVLPSALFLYFKLKG